MRSRTVATRVEVPPEILLGYSDLLSTLYELVEVCLTLRSTDDLSDLGEEDVHASDCLPIVIELHVEALDLLRIVGDDDRTLEMLFHEIAFVFASKVGTPVHWELELAPCLDCCLEDLNTLGVGHALEGFL